MPDLTLRQLANLVNVTEHTLRWRIKRNLVPGAYKFGNHWRIRSEEVAAIRGKAPEPQPDPPEKGA